MDDHVLRAAKPIAAWITIAMDFTLTRDTP
jgi:hypothetical protein